MTDVREVLRRLRLGEPARRIARELNVSRNTVAGYHRWARTHGLLTGELPDAATLATWCRCHHAAFEWFHGVPRRVEIDNLKAAIVRAVLYDPEVQRLYRKCAEHYGFLIAPCRARTPEHKVQASCCNFSRICDTHCG